MSNYKHPLVERTWGYMFGILMMQPLIYLNTAPQWFWWGISGITAASLLYYREKKYEETPMICDHCGKEKGGFLMGHYDIDRKRDCGDHEFNNTKTRNVKYDVTIIDGKPFLRVSWVEYKRCENDMEYHGGRGIGMTTGRCQIEEVVGRFKDLIPMDRNDL